MAGMGFYGALAGAGGAAQDYLKMRDQADLSYQKEALLNQLRTQQQYLLEGNKVDKNQTQYDWDKGTKQNYNIFGQPIGDPVAVTSSERQDYNDKKLEQATKIADIQSRHDDRQQGLDLRRDILASQQANQAANRQLRLDIAGMRGSGGGGGNGGNSSANGFSGFTVPKGVSGDNALSAMAHSMITGNPEVTRQATSAGIPITYLQQASERAVANMKAQYDAGQQPDLPGVVYQRVVNNLLNSPAIRKVRVPTARSLDSQDNGTYGQ